MADNLKEGQDVSGVVTMCSFAEYSYGGAVAGLGVEVMPMEKSMKSSRRERQK